MILGREDGTKPLTKGIKEMFKGFAIIIGGNLVRMELCEDVQAGTTISDPVTIFDNVEDAEAAFMNYCGMYGKDTDGQIVEVEIAIKKTVKIAKFRDGEEEAETEEDEESDE